MDELIAQFTTITGATVRNAETYLKVSDGDLPQAIQLYFDTGGADMESGPSTQSAPPPPPPPPPVLPSRHALDDDPIQIDDDEMDGDGDDDDDDDLREALRASEPTTAASGSGPGSGVNSAYDEDEAIARRLQEEFYGGAGGAGSGGENGVRAPIARTRDTLIGGDDYGYAETMAQRRMRAGRSFL